MEFLAKVTKQHLLDMQLRGATPKQAVEAILEEAKIRHPQYNAIVLQHSLDGTGFDIIAMDQ